MLLIADSGSTNTTWCVLRTSGERIIFNTEGYNPWYVNEDYICTSLSNHIPKEVDKEAIRQVKFYGAGCYPGNYNVIIDALTRVFPKSTVMVGSDLLAAANALLGEQSGFAAILGTGTNTGIYDGKSIIKNIDSLGYILGDEGSGSAIGKKLLIDYTRGYLTSELNDLFYDRFGLSSYAIIDQIYSKPLPNRFCASFCEFIQEYIQMEYFYELVKTSFTELFQNLVSRYPHYQQYSFNCVGSVGYSFKPILLKVTLEFNMEAGLILQAPMNLLIKYHENNMDDF